MLRRFILSTAAILLPYMGMAGNGVWTFQGPNGGRITDFAFDDVQPGVVYALSNGRGYKSTNGGKKWTTLNLPIKPNVVRVQDGRVLLAAGTFGSLFLANSIDQGATWNIAPQVQLPVRPSYGAGIVDIAVAPGNNKLMLLAYNPAPLFRSNDAGGTWTELKSGLPGKQYPSRIRFEPGNGRVAYVQYQSTIVKTTDGGGTWSNVSGNLRAQYFLDMAIDRNKPETVYVIPVQAGLESRLYKTEIGGKNWERLNCSCGNVLKVALDSSNPAILHVVALTYSPSRSGIIQHVWNSTDAGKSWKRADSPSFAIYDTFLSDPLSPERLLLAGQSVMLRSDDRGFHWLSSGEGIRETAVGVFSSSRSNPGVIYVEPHDDFGNAYRSKDSGKTWTVFLRSVDAEGIDPIRTIAVHPDNPNLIAAGSENALQISQDGGKTWIPKTGNSFQLLEFDRNGVLFSFNDMSVDSSTDTGSTWRVSPIHQFLVSPPDALSAAAISYSNPKVLYIGSELGRLLRSTESGRQWTIRSVFSKGSYIAGVIVDPANSDQAYAIAWPDPYKTTDGGKSWVHLSSQEGDTFDLLAMHPTNSHVLAALAGGGVRVSRDEGVTWQNLPAFPKIDFGPTDLIFTPTTLLASTSRGVYSIDFHP